ncbi:PREDICTED: uncharacterized protein LOC105966976 [Erythranthe guttata]|uniref:uncharacterized protein LOC105966976 n=1 Tax=Erythranthe guttata TaxID=4155 RepID=UPI00064DF131|nr:PREDICTED: uncharacterized protein LOC105966976 [Erythranthe guttata]|eukprot:XP_012846998.1 PREDICTED: uncharacterized protein LOC105966976 [Erythranthe guttata]
MPLLNYPTVSWFPILSSSSLSNSQGLITHGGFLRIEKSKRILCNKKTVVRKLSRNLDFVINAAAAAGAESGQRSNRIGTKEQCAVNEFVRNKFLQQEIEFPTSGLESVPGDGEGGIEMTGSMQLIREFCDLVITPEKVTRTRIFFPEANEVDFARKSAFGGSSLKLDYLTKPSFFEDFGFGTKVKMADRVKPEDELFLVGYPYFNVNEMLVVEELYKEAVVGTLRKMIIFNGELDRIRSGYYPAFFYPKLAALTQSFLPKMETVYYIHNFKGRNGGVLFRSYPGPWKVIKRVRNKYVCVHKQEKMPSLKEVALEILPSA